MMDPTIRLNRGFPLILDFRELIVHVSARFTALCITACDNTEPGHSRKKQPLLPELLAPAYSDDSADQCDQKNCTERPHPDPPRNGASNRVSSKHHFSNSGARITGKRRLFRMHTNGHERTQFNFLLYDSCAFLLICAQKCRWKTVLP